MRNLVLSGLTLLSASALVPLSATGASAQSYERSHQSYEQCVREQRNRQVAGALIGGILGAVVGAELHDDAQDRNREYRRGDRHYRGGDRHYRRGDRHRPRRHDRRRSHDDDNDGAVVAGAGLGAVAGAAIAGSGDCDNLRRGGRYNNRGYDDRRYENSRYDNRRYDDRRYDDRRYDDRRYSDADYRRNDPYYDDDPYYGDDRNSQVYRAGSDDELLGGYDSSARVYEQDDAYNSQVYRASSSSANTVSQSNGRCRTMTSSGRDTYMCEGTDGIWRPARNY